MIKDPIDITVIKDLNEIEKKYTAQSSFINNNAILIGILRDIAVKVRHNRPIDKLFEELESLKKDINGRN